MKQENPLQPGAPEASKAKDLAKTGKEAIQHVQEGAGEVLKDTAAGVKDVGKSVQTIAQDAGETGKRVASDALETGKKVMSDVAEGTKELGHAASEAAERASAAVQETKEEARSMLQRSKERVIDSAHRVGPAVRRANQATGSFVSHNVVPVSLIGFGAGWALMSGRRHKKESADTTSSAADTSSVEILGPDGQPATSIPRASTTAGGATDKLHETAHHLRERASEVSERAAQQAGHLRDVLTERTSKVKQRASDTKERAKAATTRMAEHNPLMLIALSLGAGVSTAMLFPQTKRENRLMGPTRDRVIGEAREVASSVGQVAKKAAQDLRHTVSS